MAPPISTNARYRAEADLRRDAFAAFAKVFASGALVGALIGAALVYASLG